MNPATTKEKLKEINSWLSYLDDNELSKPEKFMADSVIAFDANNGRIGIIWIERTACNSCHTRKPCLMVDQSEGEYDQAIICFDCIDLLKTANNVRE